MATTYGRTFVTKAGKKGRYVYKNGKRVGFKMIKFVGRNVKRGAGQYIRGRTYKALKRRY
jgi:hypothetical protein